MSARDMNMQGIQPQLEDIYGNVVLSKLIFDIMDDFKGFKS